MVRVLHLRRRRPVGSPGHACAPTVTVPTFSVGPPPWPPPQGPPRRQASGPAPRLVPCRAAAASSGRAPERREL